MRHHIQEAKRRAVLNMVRQILGPIYDPSKEEDYVRVMWKFLDNSDKKSKIS